MTSPGTLKRALHDANAIWQPIGELGDLVRGNGLQKKDFVDEGVPAIHYGQIYTYYGLSTEETKSFVSPELAKTLKKVNKGDVIITNTSENIEDVGKALVYLGNEQAVTGGHATVFKPFKNVMGKYLAYYTQTTAFSEYKRKFAKGAKVIDVSATDLAKIPVPIPFPDNLERSLAIQAEIVRILDIFSALKAELKAELKARRRQYKYYRHKLLTLENGQVEWKALGALAKNLDSRRRPIASGVRVKGNVPYYGASGVVDYVEDHIFDGDYLLVSEDGANLLTRNTPIAFSINGKSWVNNHAHVLSFETYVERKYVEYYLNNIDLSPYISGAAQPKLNKNNLENIMIPNPTYERKRYVVDVLDKFHALTDSISEGLPREIELRQKQYAHYRDLLFRFPRLEEVAA